MWLERQDTAHGPTAAPFARLWQGDGPTRRAPNPTQILEQLYRRESKPLRQYVRGILRSSSDAEDIVQDSFVRLWRALERGGVQNPRAVLFRTARNLALNHIRNARVRTSDAARAGADDSFERQIKTAEEELIAEEEATACRVLMDALPERCREAFVLRVVDELSYKEMAKEMRLSVSTIEKHIGKGKQICRSRLAEAKRNPNDVVAVLNARANDNESYLIAAE